MKEGHKLKRCPFCNGWNLTLDITNEHFGVRCLDCGCTGPFSTNNRTVAVSMWNATYIHQNNSALVSNVNKPSNRNDEKWINL